MTGIHARTAARLISCWAWPGFPALSFCALLPCAALADAPPKNTGFVVGGALMPLSVETGTIAVPAAVGLVNAGGYAAAGTLTSAAIMGGALNIDIAETSGPDAAAGGMAADPLSPWSRRRAVRLNARPAQAGPVSLGLSAALLDNANRTVDPEAAGWVFGTRNSAYGAAAQLGLFDGRLRLVNELAWSRRGDTAGEAHFGRARRHRLEADLLRGGGISLRANALWSRAGRGYVAPRGDAPADRETLAGGLRLGWRSATLELGRTGFRNNLDRAPGVLAQRDRNDFAVLTLALDKYRARRGVGALLPGSIAFRREAGRLRGLPGMSSGGFAAGDVTDRARRHDALTLGWSWPGANTALTLARTALDTNRPGHESEDSAERTLTLTQGFAPDGFSASLSLLLGETEIHTDGARTRAARQELTASLTATPGDGPTLTATVILRRNDLERLDAGDGDVDTGWEAIAAADLTRAIFDDDPPDGARLALMVAVKGTDTDPEDAGLRSIDLRCGVQAAFTF
jgi:hypothetical protein